MNRIAGAVGGLIVGAGAAALAASTPSSPPVAVLAGRYDHRSLNGDVSGASYYTDDIVEIVPVDATHAYVRFALNFYNGHTCSLSGVAEVLGPALVYRSPPQNWNAGNVCTLTIRRLGEHLVWDDGTTCHSYCGERGGFNGGHLAWSSHRPITYLPRLKASRQYKDALTEWSTGHAMP